MAGLGGGGWGGYDDWRLSAEQLDLQLEQDAYRKLAEHKASSSTASTAPAASSLPWSLASARILLFLATKQQQTMSSSSPHRLDPLCLRSLGLRPSSPCLRPSLDAGLPLPPLASRSAFVGLTPPPAAAQCPSTRSPDQARPSRCV
ncbi:hypothetical protein ABZP36_009635 [Zizania latifolia]